MDDAARTAAQLSIEVETKKQDLAKYKHLGGTIKTQLEQYTASVEKMEDEIQNKFPKTNELNQEFQVEKEKLAAIKQMVNTFKVGLSK